MSFDALAFAAPTVATHGSTDPLVPLGVLLPGRGVDKRNMPGRAEALPSGSVCAAVRAGSSPTAASLLCVAS